MKARGKFFPALLFAGAILLFADISLAESRAPKSTGTSQTQAANDANAANDRGADSGELPSRAGLYTLDVLIPGYGAFASGRPGWAVTFAISRIATAYIGYDAWVRMIEYRSAERAARIAITAYGPGLRFPDPYGSAWRSADEFQRLADRRAAIMSGAATLHVFLTGLSLLVTHGFYEDRVNERAPIFSIGLAPDDAPTINTPRPTNDSRALQFALHMQLAF